MSHGVSRRQELAADRLAAHTAGSDTLARALQRIYGASTAHRAFWSKEYAAALQAGCQLPLATGFGRFLAAPAVADAMQLALAAELREGRADPLDTHPSLAERLAALGVQPAGSPAQRTCAAELLEQLPCLEQALLTHLLPGLARLEHIEWSDVPKRVLAPRGRELSRRFGPFLASHTPHSLPELFAGLDHRPHRLDELRGGELQPTERAELAAAVAACALSTALLAHGWSARAAPGEPIALSCGERHIEPYHCIGRLVRGELGAAEWRAQCIALGIASIELFSGAKRAPSNRAT